MTYYKPNDSKMFADITDGMAIIINSETGVYYGFNELGTEVYSNLINGVSSEDIINKLKPWNNNAENNFKEFMDFILKNEIMLVSNDGNSNAEIEINEETAKVCDYILKADEYLDAQELLLADPIHEVKEEEGWSPEKSSLNENKEDVARREAKMVQ
ncbi:PqqD family protein [bacterium]|nr:PqqD family protein [bacterium]